MTSSHKSNSRGYHHKGFTEDVKEAQQNPARIQLAHVKETGGPTNHFSSSPLSYDALPPAIPSFRGFV